MSLGDKIFAGIFLFLLALSFWHAEYAVATGLVYIGYAIEVRGK